MSFASLPVACSLLMVRSGITIVRWNPEQENMLFLSQAATIAGFYYLHQIAVHRPFMSSSRRESPISPASTIICTNAARAAIQVIEVLYTRTGRPTHRNMVSQPLAAATRRDSIKCANAYPLPSAGNYICVCDCPGDQYAGAKTLRCGCQHGERFGVGREEY